MPLPPFVIGEWLVCPRCGMICDSPFRPAGSDVSEPELVLGAKLPESRAVPSGSWRVKVVANCPACSHHLVATAVFDGRTLLEFQAEDPA